MTDWQDIKTAPRDGTPFIALNHDREVWVSKYDENQRLLFRTNYRSEPRSFQIIEHDGEQLLREDKEFAEANECWSSAWTIWSRLYEFKPTHWMELPEPPKEAE